MADGEKSWTHLVSLHVVLNAMLRYYVNCTRRSLTSVGVDRGELVTGRSKMHMQDSFEQPSLLRSCVHSGHFLYFLRGTTVLPLIPCKFEIAGLER